MKTEQEKVPETAKTKIELKPSETLTVGNCLVNMLPHVDPESQVEMQAIIDYFEPRGTQPYSFLTLKQIYIIWLSIKTCLDNNIVLYEDLTKMELGRSMILFGKILDAPQEVKWRNFT